MTIFLVLAPFAAFSLLVLVTSLPVTLFSSAAICLAVVAYDFARGRSVKMLGAGCAVLFALVGCYIILADPDLSVSAAKLAVDSGVLAISLASLAIRRPFTLQYAREVVDGKTAELPGFLTANYYITAAWSAAFLLMVIANVLLIYVPGLPLWSGLAIAFAARNSAVYFTKWYPQHYREKLVKRAGSAAVVSLS
jgi:hypothetical protein